MVCGAILKILRFPGGCCLEKVHRLQPIMIRRYNRSQIIVGVLAIIGGLFCSWLGYLFFRYLLAYALESFGVVVSIGTETMIGWLGLVVLFSSAYSIWNKGGGLTSFGESALYFECLAGSDTGGALVVNRRLGQLTGSAHALSQLFLAGPLMLFNAVTRFANLIPASLELEGRMLKVLERSRAMNKWEKIEEYAGVEEEVGYLIQIDAIDFGTPKNVAKIKANPTYGN
jgi:hypothetical protein